MAISNFSSASEICAVCRNSSGITKTKGSPVGTLPYYNAPTRQWGFDVGLLSQSPDIFAQKFTQQPVTPPDESFREVIQDDPWIQTLLCATQSSATSYTYAVDASDRPTNCQSL